MHRTFLTSCFPASLEYGIALHMPQHGGLNRPSWFCILTEKRYQLYAHLIGSLSLPVPSVLALPVGGALGAQQIELWSIDRSLWCPVRPACTTSC